MRPPQDMARELAKILDAVQWVNKALTAQGAHDAALHMNHTVRLNPATVSLLQAEEDLNRLIEECGED